MPRALLSAVLSLSALLSPLVAAHAASYTFTTLDVPGANATLAYQINNRGQVVGYYSKAGESAWHSFLYADGVFTLLDVPFPEATNGTQAYGINNVEPYGPEATEANRRLVQGQMVHLEFDVQPRDQYGRLLAYVYVGEMMVNAELMRQGYALLSTYPPNVKHEALFVRLQREAREAKRGLWGP